MRKPGGIAWSESMFLGLPDKSGRQAETDQIEIGIESVGITVPFGGTDTRLDIAVDDRVDITKVTQRILIEIRVGASGRVPPKLVLEGASGKEVPVDESDGTGPLTAELQLGDEQFFGAVDHIGIVVRIVVKQAAHLAIDLGEVPRVTEEHRPSTRGEQAETLG